MKQSRLFTTLDEQSALKLHRIFELAFEEHGYPVSAAEDPDTPALWTVSVYVDSKEAVQVKEKLSELALGAEFATAFEQEDLPDVDWVAETLRELSAVRAGRYVVHGSHETDIVRPHEAGILIDAGLAFGTGHHGTTAGCLDMLTMLSKRTHFTNILDLGTGSGVLAIAAAKTHNAHVLASDIDPVATQTARANAQLNGTGAHVECITASGLNHRRFVQQGPFDLVIANILARPLQSLALDISRSTELGGKVILSGLLPHQKAAILATFRCHDLHYEWVHYRDGWMTLVLGKPSKLR